MTHRLVTGRLPKSHDPKIIGGRLLVGEILIAREPDPIRREMLTDFWIALLHEYERAVDAERDTAQKSQEVAAA